MIETTIKHTFTHDDSSLDTDAIYRTLLLEIDELIENANLHEASVSLTFDDNETKLVMLVEWIKKGKLLKFV